MTEEFNLSEHIFEDNDLIAVRNVKEFIRLLKEENSIIREKIAYDTIKFHKGYWNIEDLREIIKQMDKDKCSELAGDKLKWQHKLSIYVYLFVLVF